MTQKVVLSCVLLMLSACGAMPMPTPEQAKGAEERPRVVPEAFSNKCDVAKGQLRPLIVEWDAPDRAALEARAHEGQIVVRYAGCELEVLRRCKPVGKRRYAYTAITPKDEVVTMASTDELYASIPVHAAKFEGKLQQSGQLAAEMKIVGEYGVSGLPPSEDQLEGECEGATHVVSALTVGAFSFSAGKSRAAGVSANVLGAGAGVETSRKSEALSRDGDVGSCAASKRGDGAPPDGCGATLRLELAKLLPKGEGIPTCKPGEKLVGKVCKALEKPSKLAAEDRDFVDDKRGFGWGVRCFKHAQARSLPEARAACQKGLEADPTDETKSAILYNYAMVEDTAGDAHGACVRLSQALAVFAKNGGARKKYEALGCEGRLREGD